MSLVLLYSPSERERGCALQCSGVNLISFVNPVRVRTLLCAWWGKEVQINGSLEKLYNLLPLKKIQFYLSIFLIPVKTCLSDSFVPANVNSGEISLALQISSRIKLCIAHEEFCPKVWSARRGGMYQRLSQCLSLETLQRKRGGRWFHWYPVVV